MINHISKETAVKLYNSASKRVPAGANIKKSINPEKPKNIDYTKIIAAQKKQNQ